VNCKGGRCRRVTSEPSFSLVRPRPETRASSSKDGRSARIASPNLREEGHIMNYFPLVGLDLLLSHERGCSPAQVESPWCKVIRGKLVIS
jgi:hypothetical protein